MERWSKLGSRTKKKVGRECEKEKRKFRLKRDSADRVNVKRRERVRERGNRRGGFLFTSHRSSFAPFIRAVFAYYSLESGMLPRGLLVTRWLLSSFRCSLVPLSAVTGSASLFGPLFGTGNDLDCFGRKVVEREEEKEKT